MSPPLALHEDYTPRWKYFARTYSAVEAVQNSFRRSSLSSSEKDPFAVKPLPCFTGQYRSFQGIMKWIKSHHSKSHLRFMEMFVETIADSFADSPLLTCDFFFLFFLRIMHPAQQKNLDGPQNVLEWNLAVLSVQASDNGCERMFSHSLGRYSMDFLRVPDAGLIRDKCNPGPILKEPG